MKKIKLILEILVIASIAVALSLAIIKGIKEDPKVDTSIVAQKELIAK